MSDSGVADGHVWLAESGELSSSWTFATAAFTPDGSKIVSATILNGGPLEVRSTRDFSLVNSRRLGEGISLSRIVITGDGRNVVGVTGGDIVLYDVETLEEVDIWTGAHNGQITHLDVSESGAMLASVGVDGFARVWDLESGELLHEIQVSEDDRGQAVAFADDDQHLLVSVGGGPLAICTLDVQELSDIARGRLVRGFTEAECLQCFPDTDCPTLEEMRSGG